MLNKLMYTLHAKKKKKERKKKRGITNPRLLKTLKPKPSLHAPPTLDHFPLSPILPQ
jgi:hypothetical protein